MSDSAYTDAVARGQRFLDSLAFSMEKADAPLDNEDGLTPQQSVFTNVADLAKHGFVKRPLVGPFTLEPLRECLESLHVSLKPKASGGNNTLVHHVHDEAVSTGEVSYLVNEPSRSRVRTYLKNNIQTNNAPKKASKAYFWQVVNPTDGVIIAVSNATAPHMGIQFGSMPISSPLRHWSDVAYLQLLAAAKIPTTPVANLKNLKYVIRFCCQNHTTNSVVKQVLREHNMNWLPTWPGVTFPVAENCEAGMALLGTPNGAGVGYLLAQHREQLGRKYVGWVTVFYAPNKDDIFRWPTLLFWIKDEDKRREEQAAEKRKFERLSRRRARRQSAKKAVGEESQGEEDEGEEEYEEEGEGEF